MSQRTARSVALLVLLGLAAAPLAAAEAPTCSGRDLARALREESPAEWARIEATANATLNSRAILWRIEGPSSPPSFLFGTVHLTDARLTKLSPAVEQALNGARRVALEIADLSPQAVGKSMAELQSLLVFSDGRTLNTLLTSEEQNVAETAVAKVGMPAAAMQVLRPWVVTMLLALSDCERQRAASGLPPLDQALGEKAQAKGSPVVGLETLEDQMRAMAAVPEADQLTALKAGLKLYDHTDDFIETTLRAYLDRNLGLVWPLHEAYWRRAGFDPAAFASFQKELVVKRNHRMREAARSLLNDGGAFIAVGALHLPGPDGLVELLRGAGFKVTAVE